MNWYVLYTKPRSEKKVEEQLLSLGINAYYPIHSEFKLWSDRKKKIYKPVLPSVVLVNIDDKDINRVFECPLVVRYMFWMGKRAVVRQSEIDILKKYLDGGYNQVKKSILKIIISRYGDFTDVLKEEIDFKSKLHIWCQRKRYTLEYKVISEKIISGSWDYSIEAYINNKPYGQGRGPNKKVAEQIASKETIELLGGF